MRLRKRPYGAMHVGKLPAGCVECEKGGKMVVFVTGRCPYSCYYCPISLEKRGRDVTFADEMRVRRDSDLLEEARSISATGAGITGGDPMADIDRTTRYVRLLKDEFGDAFHIHVYTMGTDVRKMARLIKAGTDEIRFHPPPALWRRMGTSAYPSATKVAVDSGLDVGLEVPLFPGRVPDLIDLIRWVQDLGLGFVNLNELEFSDSNRPMMTAEGHRPARGKLYGVAGSDNAARKILLRRWSIPVHYCTSTYKDSWQLRERIKRRARNVSQPWEVVTDDGTLVKGVVEGPNLAEVRRALHGRFRVPKNLVWMNGRVGRLEVAPWILEEIASELDSDAYIIEEYPTADRLEVERRRLG